MKGTLFTPRLSARFNILRKGAGFIAVSAVFFVYLFWTDFDLVKKLVGYNAPELKKPDIIALPGESALPHLSISGGFKISVFAKDLEKPRVIAFDPAGKMLVSETKAGRVVLLADLDNDGMADGKKVLLEGLNSPHGIAFYKKPQSGQPYIYIAEANEVRRYAYDIKKSELTDKVGQNIATFSGDGGHFTRTIAFGPNFRSEPIIEGTREKETLSGIKLYISVGSSCDVCVEQSWKRAAILESDPEGTFTAEFAGGLRNAVFFTFHPETKEIWATEMGRDDLGDNLPPDEINIVRVAGPEHEFGARRYGWPFCYGNKVKDTTFKPEKVNRIDIPRDCGQTEPATIEIPAHSAPLGLVFVANEKWPKEWQNNLLVAYHGSWNRSEPTGYKIVRFIVDKNGQAAKVEDFIIGWLSQDKKNTYGRPVDLKFGPDEALYISDDAAGLIYKVVSNL